MAIIDVAKKVALKVGIGVPSLVYGATERDSVVLASLLNETADDIASVYDWQTLRKVATITGDGSTVSFNLPTDFARMLVTASLWTSRNSWAIEHILSSDQWLEMLELPYMPSNGSWTIYGDQIHILAAMATAETAKFFYITNALVRPETGAMKPTFTSDTDTYRLSEKLLGLAAVVKWKSQKGEDYSDDLVAYNIELANQINKDAGSKPKLSGNAGGVFQGVRPAWGGTISGVP